MPLVLSAPGEGVKVYDIPEEIVLRVHIEHPHFPWFKDMGLQWYALPAVSEMLFDCGGLQFTCAPFNGWYMGTEIGARDFCDPQRYNVTEVYIFSFKTDIICYNNNLLNYFYFYLMLKIVLLLGCGKKNGFGHIQSIDIMERQGVNRDEYCRIAQLPERECNHR